MQQQLGNKHEIVIDYDNTYKARTEHVRVINLTVLWVFHQIRVIFH